MSTATYPIFSDGGNGATLDTGNGFIDYNNTSAPLTLVADTWTTITNDGLGLSTNKAYAPKGVAELMNVSTGAFDFTELEKGDGVYIRNDFTVVPSTNNALIEVRYLLGAGASAYILEKTAAILSLGSGRPYRPAATVVDYIYMGDPNTVNNPVTLQVRLSSNGTLTNAGAVIQVVKKKTII